MKSKGKGSISNSKSKKSKGKGSTIITPSPTITTTTTPTFTKSKYTKKSSKSYTTKKSSKSGSKSNKECKSNKSNKNSSKGKSKGGKSSKNKSHKSHKGSAPTCSSSSSPSTESSPQPSHSPTVLPSYSPTTIPTTSINPSPIPTSTPSTTSTPSDTPTSTPFKTTLSPTLKPNVTPPPTIQPIPTPTPTTSAPTPTPTTAPPTITPSSKPSTSSQPTISFVPTSEFRYTYNQGSCPNAGSTGLPCASTKKLYDICDKYDPSGNGSFRQCLKECRPSYCCIHDNANNILAPSCSNDENCAQYSYCYIVWWKLADTVGPLNYIRIEQDDDFYDVPNEELKVNLNINLTPDSTVTNSNDLEVDETNDDFWNQVMTHLFKDRARMITLGLEDGKFSTEALFLNVKAWESPDMEPVLTDDGPG